MEIAIRGNKKLLCPSCKGPLNVALSEGAEVDVCVKCQGVWVDHIDDKSFLRLEAQSLTIDEIRRLRKIYEPLGRVEEVKYRKCPICDDLMYRKNWGGYSGVIVDQCEQHGTWFDPGEAEKIREYVALGGIDFEKLRYHEGGLSEVNSKLKKEVSRLDDRITGSRHLLTRLWTTLTYK